MIDNIMKTVCICGGGSLGHVIAGWLSARNHTKVHILTNRPEKWTHEITIDTPDGDVFRGNIDIISNDPKNVIPSSDIVLLCLPGFLIKEELGTIKPYLTNDTYVGSVFSSTGFFFEAQKILNKKHNFYSKRPKERYFMKQLMNMQIIGIDHGYGVRP